MKRRLATAARVVGTVALVALFVATFDASGLRSLATRDAAGWVAAALVAHAVGNLTNGLAWRHLLNRAGGAIGLRDAVVHDLVSVFWSTILPGGVAGEIVKGVRLARGIDPGAVAVNLLAARFLGGGLACLLGLVCLPFSGLEGPVATVGGAALAATTAVGSAGLAVLWMGPGALARLPKLAARVPLGRFPEGRDLALATALTLGTHVTFAWMFVTCFAAAGGEISFAAAATISALTSVAQLLPIAIGGIGVRELTIAGLGAMVVPAAQADAAAITISGAFAAFILVGGVLELTGHHRRPSYTPSSRSPSQGSDAGVAKSSE